MTRRELLKQFVTVLPFCAGGGCGSWRRPADPNRQPYRRPSPAASSPGTTLLPNGIVLPSGWPPARCVLDEEPQSPPYLEQAPAVIPIDVGRQLFVDDFLIEHTDLNRTFHAASYHPACPVLRPTQPWEDAEKSPWGLPADPTAMPFSDGVWYDPGEQRFKMWYMAGLCAGTAYAWSEDGIHWHKPCLDVVPGTNLVDVCQRDSSTLWFDQHDPDPNRRYKLFVWVFDEGQSTGRMQLKCSPDGVHFGGPVVASRRCGDRTTVFFDPLNRKWVLSLRAYDPGGGLPIQRIRRYYAHEDPVELLRWWPQAAIAWTRCDRLDPRRTELNVPPELYNLDAVGYESLLLGLFGVWYGQPEDRAKPNEIYLGFSRDGFSWHRPWRQPFIGISEHYGDWNWANVQSAGGGCLIVGDQLYFYVSGRAGHKGSKASGVCSTGLAVLRRDGFASMVTPSLCQRDGSPYGTLTTRPLRFRGRFLFVNADASRGEVRAEVLDEHDRVLEPFTAEACVPVRINSTQAGIFWKSAENLVSLAGRTLRLRFLLRHARLYAFWISPDKRGSSRGFPAAGGPGTGS